MRTILEICQYRTDKATYSYFEWRLSKGKMNWEVSFSRARHGVFQFMIDLPFVHVTNTLYMRCIPSGTVFQHDEIVPVVSGKILHWKIKIRD